MAKVRWTFLARVVGLICATLILSYLTYNPPLNKVIVVGTGAAAQFLLQPSPLVASFTAGSFVVGMGGLELLPLSSHVRRVASFAIIWVSFISVYFVGRYRKVKKNHLRNLVDFLTKRRLVRTTESEKRPRYLLVVLGSGGHTKEMLIMMEHGFEPSARFHRRYLVSSGDQMSLKHLAAFEAELRDKAKEGDLAGTYDVHVVPRARRVHQSLLTTPFTALQSILCIFPVLLVGPDMSGFCRRSVPDVIVTNGPATGFFVALAAFLLRMFYFVETGKMQVLFIESWARIKTLSLTGKLLYYTGLADLFLVQHDAIAKRYKVPNAGWLVLGDRAGKPNKKSSVEE